MLGNYVTPVPAQQRVGKHWYLGSADAIYQSLNLIKDEKPDIVVVVGADHVYRMDFSQMVSAHRAAAPALHGRRDPAADRAGRPVRRDRRAPRRPGQDPRLPREAHRPGGAAGQPRRGARVDGQLRLRRRRAGRGGHPRRHRDRLQARHGRRHRAVVRTPPAGRRVYDYKDNDVAGSTDRDRGYWRDVGTLASYYDAHMDVVSPLPVFNLYNFDWPIYTSYGPQPPAKLVKGAAGRAARRRGGALAGCRRQRRHGSRARCCPRRSGSGPERR